MDEVERTRQDRQALAAEIQAAGSTLRGTSCNCPAPDHDDGKPSASIHHDGDGAWRVYCWSRQCFGTSGGKPLGADVFDLRAMREGRPVDELLREARGADQTTKPKRPSLHEVAKAAYERISADELQRLGDALGVSADSLRRLCCGWIKADELLQLDTKCSSAGCYTFPMQNGEDQVVGIRLRTPSGFKYSVSGGTNGVFIPAGLTGDGTLYVTESPTDAAALLDMGLSAIARASNTTGDDAITRYVERHRAESVVVVMDRDSDADTAQRTQQAAETLSQRIMPLVGSARIIQPPEGFKDVREWRQSGAGQDDVEALADQATSHGPADELADEIEAEIAGTRVAVPFPWRLVTRGTQALLPGHVTMLCGDPGDGKSLWLLEALGHWHNQGVPWVVCELEQNRRYHLRRALAQRVRASWVTNLNETCNRPNEARAIFSEHRDWMDRFGCRIYDAPDQPPSYGALIEWTEARCAEGYRIIAIDPITKAEQSDKPWEDARQFLGRVVPILERYGASLVIVTHPKKGKQKGQPTTLDDLAGGAAWQYFSQCILWIERHDKPKSVTVKNFGDAMPVTEQVQVNRTLRIMKSRDGPGGGWHLGYWFDQTTLRFNEKGAITNAKKAIEI
jgi:hypothetical protein